jgi:hypothetical protein
MRWVLGLALALGAICVANSTAQRPNPTRSQQSTYANTYAPATQSNTAWPSTRPTLVQTTPQVAENGSSYGDISEQTGRPKTIHVEGYYRQDGTYVRGHYRSAPSSNTLAPATTFKPYTAENGSWYGEPSKVTNLPKTTYVSGYYRKDGTYVRSHYRSRR